MPVQNLLLYTTLGCHLCEAAEGVALSVINPNIYHLVKVEISENNELIERYGIRIPVLAFEGQHAELEWPFDASQLLNFIGKSSVK